MEDQAIRTTLEKVEHCLTVSIDDLISMRSNMADCAAALESAAQSLRAIAKTNAKFFAPENLDLLKKIAHQSSTSEVLLEKAAAFHLSCIAAPFSNRDGYSPTGVPQSDGSGPSLLQVQG